MDRYVVMVDAGYLFRQSLAILGAKSASLTRADLEVTDAAGLVAAILRKCQGLLNLEGKELLRVYWYDGALSQGLTAQQRALAGVDDVQLSLGTVENSRQKGVDPLIVADLLELTAQRAICDAIVVTGDGDLVVAIKTAQMRGVRVAALGVEDLAAGVAHHQSYDLRTKVDRVGVLGADDLAPHLSCAPPVEGASAAGAAASSARGGGAGAEARRQIEELVRSFVEWMPNGPPPDAVDRSTGRLEPNIDRALLNHVKSGLEDRQLNESEKIHARDVFKGLI